MTSSISKFTHLKIPLEEISSATNNFADANLIGQGAFGKVYKGRLRRSKQWIDISARRLDRRYGLGGVEFWTEISMLSSLKHRNLVSIIGFCDEKHEKIIINKYEAKGSLQEYLNASTLMWMQRLKICVGIGSALRYLNKSSVIHHNINSSTILLDDNWEAKLSGFEFSMKNPSTRNDRVLLTDVGGTIGYVDPEYEKTGGVTYKSDVFSFGVVLFEILCGRKAFIQNKHHQFLAPLARLHYSRKNVDEIVDPDLWKSMDPQSFLVFSQIAYSCLEEQGAQRPDIDDILNELEKAHKLQRDYENPAEKSRFAAQVLSTSYVQFLQVVDGGCSGNRSGTRSNRASVYAPATNAKMYPQYQYATTALNQPVEYQHQQSNQCSSPGVKFDFVTPTYGVASSEQPTHDDLYCFDAIDWNISEPDGNINVLDWSIDQSVDEYDEDEDNRSNCKKIVLRDSDNRCER